MGADALELPPPMLPLSEPEVDEYPAVPAPAASRMCTFSKV